MGPASAVLAAPVPAGMSLTEQCRSTGSAEPVRFQSGENVVVTDGDKSAENTGKLALKSGRVENTSNGATLTYPDVDFGQARLVSVTVNSSIRDDRAGKNPRLEFYLGEISESTRVAEMALPLTDGWNNRQETTVSLATKLSGTQTLIVVMRADAVNKYNYVSNLDWFQFSPAGGGKPDIISDVVLGVGATEADRALTWYSDTDVPQTAQLVKADEVVECDFPDTARTIETTGRGQTTSNQFFRDATVSGLEENSEYAYRVGSDADGWSDIYTFRTQDFDGDFSFLFFGDSQIGASGKLAQDEAGWVDTVDLATRSYPNAELLVSAGDQVQDAANEDQYDAFLKPEQLRGVPFVATNGNHDVGSKAYEQHFNVPNEDLTAGPGTATASGGDYSFIYKGVLFVNINSNSSDFDSHYRFIDDVVAKHGAEAKWKVLTMHHSIYSVGSHVGDADITALRESLPEKISGLGFDAVLMGHDHNYTRSFLIKDGKLAEAQEVAAQKRIEARDGEVLYLTANSSSGSKYYDTTVTDAWYASVTNQEKVRNYSVVDVTDSTLTFRTLRSQANGSRMPVNSVVDEVTLSREAAPEITLPETTQTPQGADFDPLKGVKATDNADGDITDQLLVTGSVDTAKIGEYKMTYSVSDARGNETTADRVVAVVEKGDLPVEPGSPTPVEPGEEDPVFDDPGIDPTAPLGDFTQYVNPFVSTQDDFGHDLPGAVSPSSIVKINPMTTPTRSTSGYDYAENQIAGFTHTNLDGAGGDGGGGDLLVVPTYVTYESRPSTASYAKDFNHNKEWAEPGYYGVELATTTGADGAVKNAEGVGPILAEAAADVRTGQDRFTFPQAGSASLVVDLANNFAGRKSATLEVTQLEDGRIALSGAATGNNYRLYYYAETTKPVTGVRTWDKAGAALRNATTLNGADIGAILDFEVTAGEQLGLKVAISPISAEQAETDLAVEMGKRGFDDIRADAKAAWNVLLSRMDVTASETSDPTGDLKALFYTHLYRLFGTPMNATSTSGTYRGLDGKVYTADGYTHYAGWGFWDDFRKYDVIALGYPEVYSDIAQSIVDYHASFQASGKALLEDTIQPVPSVRFERGVVVVADAIAKGAKLQGLADAWPALVSQAEAGYANPDNVRDGYIANEVDDTLGTAYDDWALATIADTLGKTAEAADFRLRAGNWANLFKENSVTLADGNKTGLVFPKDANGNWVDVDPEKFEGFQTYQGSLWQYNWYVTPDVGGMIDLMGGEETALKALSFMHGEQAPDDGTRMLRSSANEVDLQVPYLFNYVGAPAKTQYWVRQIYTGETWNRYIATASTDEAGWASSGGELTPPQKVKVYQNSPQGFLPTMDNDTGTMSGMFVAAALGLFPVAAGSDEYQIGTPFFDNVRIRYDSGRHFDINANGVSPSNYYIQDASLNDVEFERTWLTYDQIVSGGELSFDMGAKPSEWAADSVAPASLSDDLPSSVYDPVSATVVGSREFHEADAGNGTIGNEIALTIANGTFAGRNGDDLAASGVITAENVPDGLTLVATRTGDRAVTLSLSGAAKMSGMSHSIDDLAITITDDSFSRAPSTWAREFMFKVTFDGVTLHVSDTNVLADPDGTVDAVVPLTLSGATFAGDNGRDLIADGVLTLPGLPEGIVATAIKSNAETVELHLTGSFDPARSARFSLAFVNAALNGASAAALKGAGVAGLGHLTLKVDKSWRGQLLALLEDADLVHPGNYAADSFADFRDARDDAHAVLGKSGARDEDLEFAFRTLERTSKALHVPGAVAPLTLQGEKFDLDNGKGVKKESAAVGNTANGAEISYTNVNFGEHPYDTFMVRSSGRDGRIGKNPRLELYLDDVTDANRIGMIDLPGATGADWKTFIPTTISLDKPVSGTHTLIVRMLVEEVAGQSTNYVSNLDLFEFTASVDSTVPADSTALRATIAEATDIYDHEERYISIDFAVFRAAYDAAVRVAGDENATQGQVDDARRVLDLAASQLEWKAIRELPQLIIAAEAVDPAAHAPALIEELRAAAEAAKGIKEGASYEEYAAAVKRLAAALDALDAPPGNPGGEEPGTGTPGDPGGEAPGGEEPGTGTPGDPGGEAPGGEEPVPAGRPLFTPDAPAAGGADLPEDLRGQISASMSGRQVTISGLVASEWHFVYVYSKATALGWVQASQSGSARVALPQSLPGGVHRVAVLNVDGELIGWTEITVGQSGASPSGPGGLAETGSDAAQIWGIGAVSMLLLFAGGALLLARRRGCSAN